MTSVSVPGKIHLLGEHAVVYGRPALLAAIDRRLYVNIKCQISNIKNKKNEKIIIKTSEKDKLVREAISVFKKAFSIKTLPEVEISITSEIPIGCGLGSSAALAAATSGALMKVLKNIWSLAKINELAYEIEKLSHGNPSGADNTAVVFGGLVWYRRELDFLKLMRSLPQKQYKTPRFLLLDSGRPVETTKEMVVRVANLYRKKKKFMEGVFNDQEKQTKRLLLSFHYGSRKELIAAIRKGERNLEKMDVVGSFAKKIVREIERIGGAAKVSGAGGRKLGSGMLLCYHEDLEKIVAVAKKYQSKLFPVRLGGGGIRIEGGNEAKFY